MLKKLNKYETQHILNVRKVEKMIDRHFYKACQDTAFLTYGLDARLSDDALFTFADYPYLTRRLNKILDTLKNRTFMTVVSGIKASWDLSKAKNDNLVHSLFGEGVDAARFNRYYSTRTGAVNAFIKRVDNGLSLSDKVWKYTERFKNEIELGIDCGLRDGLSAPEIARSLKMYLQYPDKLFRRVRTQHGILKLSKTAAAFHPGQGVYRSSYKNARRLAATETNIAYRTADFERWQDFDFVVGIEIKLSNNHTLNGKPFTDICDKLKGKYPKDFKFVGWHPLCRCHVLSILKTPKEIAEDMKRESQGLPPISSEDSTNAITSLPDNFNNWASANSDRIQRATRRGTLPYFIADNFNVGKKGELVRKTLEAKPKTEVTKAAAPPKLSLLQRAEQRHKARMEEEEKAIQKAWLKRNRINCTREAKAALIGKTARHPAIDGDIIFTTKGIKEAINQPHKYFIEKNKAVVNIIELIGKGEYIKCVLDTKHDMDICHYIKIVINGEPAYIVIKQHGKQYLFYTIVDKLKK
jgi:hypothetical protein